MFFTMAGLVDLWILCTLMSSPIIIDGIQAKLYSEASLATIRILLMPAISFTRSPSLLLINTSNTRFLRSEA